MLAIKLAAWAGLSLTAHAVTVAASAQPRVDPLGLPLTFEKNTGRFDPRAKFIARSGGTTVFITDDGVVMVLPPRERRDTIGGRAKNAPTMNRRAATRIPPSRDSGAAVVRMRLVGAKPGVEAAGLQRQRGIVNYLRGSDPRKWVTNVPTYAKVAVKGVYPGVDLMYYAASRREVASSVTPSRTPGTI
jgi:hypothetical protein